MTWVPILDASVTIQDASAAMLDDHVEAAIVVDGPRLCALVTARDVAGSLGHSDVGSTLVADIAHWDPLVVREEESLGAARERIRATEAGLAVVIGEAGRPVGVLPGDR